MSHDLFICKPVSINPITTTTPFPSPHLHDFYHKSRRKTMRPGQLQGATTMRGHIPNSRCDKGSTQGDRADRRADGRAYKVRPPFLYYIYTLLTYLTTPTAPLPLEHEKYAIWRVFFMFCGSLPYPST